MNGEPIIEPTVFAENYPIAVDFLREIYDADQSRFDEAASKAGYRFVGYRLGYAVFSTKGIE